MAARKSTKSEDATSALSSAFNTLKGWIFGVKTEVNKLRDEVEELKASRPTLDATAINQLVASSEKEWEDLNSSSRSKTTH